MLRSTSKFDVTIHAAWLTMNPNLGASARTLQDWVLLGRDDGLDISVILQTDGELRRWLVQNGVPCTLDPMFWPDSRHFMPSVAHALTLRRWIRDRGAQVIHCYEHDLYPFAIALRWITGLPLLCHVHFSLERGFAAWAFGAPRKQPDAIIWTSHQQQADCAAAMAGIVPAEIQHVVPLGLDLNRFGSQFDRREAFRQRLGIAPDQIVIANACHLRARKHVDDFLEIVAALQQRHPNVIGLLAAGGARGDEAYARDVIPRIRAMETTGRFQWLGHLEPVEPFMHAGDIFLSTSEYETFGMSVLEAMACGKPVAAYRGGSVYEIVGDTGRIAETNNVASLLAATETLVSDPELRRTLGAAARQRVIDDYNPRNSLRQLKQLYASILEAPVRPFRKPRPGRADSPHTATPVPFPAPRLLLATNSRDRGSTSRTLEAWTRLLPAVGIAPVVSVGGDGPLLSALRDAGTPVYTHQIRRFFDWKRPTEFLTAIARLALRIRQTRSELVHLNEHEHYPVVGRAAYLAGVPVVVHVRFRPEPAMCQWLFKAPYTPRRVFFTSRTQMTDSADAVATVVPRDRFRLVYNGLDFDVFGRDTAARARLRHEWGVGPETILIGTASSISRRKRLDHVIRLVAELSRSGLDVRGFIAGQPYFEEDQRELASLRRLVAELGADRIVTFLGYVEPAEPLYHAWDVCVSTSAYETFGMTVLEAMACGCPLVAYPGGSVAEVIGEAGDIVPDGDLPALVAAVSRLASDPHLCASRAAQARARARDFDVRMSVAQLIEEYRAVLAEVHSRGRRSVR